MLLSDQMMLNDYRCLDDALRKLLASYVAIGSGYIVVSYNYINDLTDIL